jgi:DNA-binding CsgD family transcriptional regulator
VLGSTIDVRVLSQLVGRPTGAMVPVLEAARETGLVREHGERLAFRHDLVREALYTSLPIAVRAELHLDAARSLAAAGIDPSKMADHLMRGARPGDPQAVASLRKAGVHAAARSPAVAVPLLRRALELTDEVDPDREEIGAELAVSLMWSGRVVEVEKLCRAAAERDFGPPAEMTFRVCLVQALVAQGRSEEALEALGVASTSPTLSGPNRSRLLAWASYAAWTAGDLEAADDAATLAIATAEEAADDFAWCVATACRAAVANRRGWFHEALHILQPALDRADRSPGRVVHRFQLNNYLGAGLIDLDRLDEAKQALHRGRTLAESLGSAWTIPPYHWIAAFASFWAGGWDDAIAELETAARLAADVGTATVLAAAHALRSIIALQRGDAATAEASTSAGEKELERAGRQFQMEWVGWSRALVLDASGHHAGACAVLSRTWDDCVARGMVCQYAVLGPDLVRLALETGDHPRAGSVASRVEEAATRAGTPTVAGAALRCTGLIQRHPETLLRAVDTFRQAGRPFLMALTLEEAGSALVSARREQEGQAVLQDALRVLEQLEASRPAARVDARLRALGVRRGSRAPRGRSTVGWEALTPTELRIVGLIAHGLSNPEIAEQLFLSRRTVQTHVSHALAKLGFRSRVELATEATRRGGA